MNIDPKHLPLLKLLEGRLFRIPEYQRAYSWGPRQRHDLFADIDALIARDDDATHFMATVVVLARGNRPVGVESFQVVEVVDGQQRLTTLVLLLRAVQRALAAANAAPKVQRRLDELLVKGDDLSLVLLQTNHDTSHVFRDYLRAGTRPDNTTAQTQAERNLIGAITDCEAYLSDLQPEQILDLATVLLNRLTFIVHTLTDERVVYTVFEVLNSRGLSVAWIDKLKSMLMAIAFKNGDPDSEHLKELHEVWKQVYRALGLREGLSDETLRFAAVLLTGKLNNGRLLSIEGAAEAIREWCEGDTAKAIQASRWLYTVVEGLNAIGRRTVLAPLMSISQARFVALSVQLSSLSDGDKERVLLAWERTMFRVFGIANKDARSLSGELVRLGTQIYHGKLDAAAADQSLGQLAAYKSWGDIREQLEDNDCYNGWKPYLRYLLYRYEEHLAQLAGEKVHQDTWTKIWAARLDDTIEHILPQSQANGEGYAGKVFVHRLGNLTLLPPGMNSQLQDRAFAKKQEVYAKQPLHQVRALANDDKWNLATIAAREDAILTWIESLYTA